MHTDEERMEFLQHVTKLRRDALRKENGDARTDADELDVLDGAQFTEKVSQLIVGKEQRIASAEEDVADGRGAPDVIELAIEFGMEIVAGSVADEPRAGAIAAIGGATVGDQKEHAIGIAMDQTRNW